MGCFLLVAGIIIAFSFSFELEDDLASFKKSSFTADDSFSIILICLGRLLHILSTVLHKKFYLMEGYKQRFVLFKSLQLHDNASKPQINIEDLNNEGELRSA